MGISNTLKSKSFTILCLAFLFFLAGFILSWKAILVPSPEKLASRFSEELNIRIKDLREGLDQFSLKYGNDFPITVDNNLEFKKWDKKGFVFLVYQKDSLVFWTDNTVPFPNLADTVIPVTSVVHLANGWYLETGKKLSSGVLVKGLALIKNDYPYENQYLKNEYHSSFSAIPNDSISFLPQGYPVKDGKSNALLYYNPSPVRSLAAGFFYATLCLFLLAGILLFLSFYHFFGKLILYRKRPVLFFFAFAADVILIRMVFFWFHIPGLFYTTSLFSPYYFAASTFLPSLGEFFIHAAVFLFLSAMFFKSFRNVVPDIKNRIVRVLLQLGIPVLLILFNYFLVLSFNLLISDSSFSITLSSPFNVTPEILVSFLILVFLCISCFLICYILLRFLFQILPFKLLLTAVLFCALVLGFLLYFHSLPVLIPVVVFVILTTFLKYRFFHHLPPFTFSSVFFYILVFSFLSTILLLTLDQKKELGQRKLLVQKLSADRDPLAEFMIQETTVSVQKDSIIRQLIEKSPFTEADEQEAITYISQKYFGNYWQKYNLDFTFCTRERILNVVVPNNTLINCQDYFSNLVKIIGKPTLSRNLYFLDYGTGSINYLAVLPLTFDADTSADATTLFIDITSKRIPKGLGYPELLISKESLMVPDLNNYSYAVYKKDNLIRSVGKYSYSLNVKMYGTFTERFTEFERNQYCHLLYKVDKEKNIIISLKSRTILDNIAPFSYFSILFSFFILILILLLAPLRGILFKNLNFRYRLQLSMILIILFSFITIGITSGVYIVKLNHSKNVDTLTEKAHSILTEIQQKLGGKEYLSADMSNDLYFLLNKFSMIFFSDINLFDLQGNLLASSRPLIFEEGLISNVMNRQSYQELTFHQKSMYIHQDKIGNYSFLSAYLPFRNEQDKLVGYLNLPYFARQDEIQSELSDFLVAFINIYVLLVAFSVILAILISRYISKPVLQIRDKISRVKLGKPNEKIEWHVKDEIGALVEEYNAMIDKLAFSAEQLAQTERESAWREMARQVAHEIKNPLTPMKLSVQHLVKSYEEKAPDWDKRLQRFTQTLIEQIDNLSDIASEFSDFAKMPELKKEKLNLKEVIESVIILYRTNPDLTFSIEAPENLLPIIEGDKNQLLRVFVNLFKNSVQAMVAEKKGEICIRLREEEYFYLVEIQDNGLGIPRDQQPKIFSPNFTTKTGGMGLGLAMVKSIISDHQGNITFCSEEGEGTTFFISLPKPGKII